MAMEADGHVMRQMRFSNGAVTQVFCPENSIKTFTGGSVQGLGDDPPGIFLQGVCGVGRMNGLAYPDVFAKIERLSVASLRVDPR